MCNIQRQKATKKKVSSEAFPGLKINIYRLSENFSSNIYLKRKDQSLPLNLSELLALKRAPSNP
jgi:hypothetical protein